MPNNKVIITSKLNKNESGFSIIEILLVLVVVATIGLIGWMVYDNHRQVHLPTPTPAGNTLPTKSSKASQSTAATNEGTVTSAGIFEIPPLGIEITNVPTSLSDLEYGGVSSGSGVDPNNKTTTPVKLTGAYFSTSSLASLDSECLASDGPIGTLGRADGTYVNNDPEDDTFFVKQFNGFYITYSHPQYNCYKSTSSAAENLQQSQTSTLETLITNPANLQPIP
jgi:hypothetical protein